MPRKMTLDHKRGQFCLSDLDDMLLKSRIEIGDYIEAVFLGYEGHFATLQRGRLTVSLVAYRLRLTLSADATAVDEEVVYTTGAVQTLEALFVGVNPGDKVTFRSARIKNPFLAGGLLPVYMPTVNGMAYIGNGQIEPAATPKGGEG